MPLKVKPSIFIGSSSEQLEVVKEMELHLSKFAEVTCWDGIFNPGQTFLTDLSRSKDQYDFAIFIITPDDTLVSRGAEYLSTRDNVIFEMGLFIGSIGFERVYCVRDQNIKGKILSDYHGVTFISYDGNRADKNLSQALSPACTQIKKVVENIGIRKKNIPDEETNENNQNDIVGLSKIYDTYDEAEKDIINDLQTTQGPVRLFVQIASKSFGAKGIVK
jgi:predicted nucleotide-binding protein